MLLMVEPAVVQFNPAVQAASALCDTNPSNAAPANSAASLDDTLVLFDFIMTLLFNVLLKKVFQKQKTAKNCLLQKLLMRKLELLFYGGPAPVVKPRSENGERIHGGSAIGSGITKRPG